MEMNKMTNTILLRKDKSLTKSTFRTIYQNEHYSDKIQFLIDQDFMDDDIHTYTIILFVTLPKPDEITGESVTNRARYLTIDEELYKDKYRIELPVTITLTESVGDVVMWMQFSKETEDGSFNIHKSDIVVVPITASGKGTDSYLDGSEGYDVLAQIQEDIANLKENKMDKYYEYDLETGELQLYANGEEAGEEVLIDKEVNLVNW
jgi:hypothetical protein